MVSFEQELELAERAGVSHPENRPFLLLPANPNGRGVLLVHGFTATPREMRSLGEVLCAAGFTLLGIRLPGHGTTPEDLAERTADEWQAAVERGYQILQQRNLSISGVGLSTGALLLLKASRRCKFSGLALLSPFLKLSHPLAEFAGILSFIQPFQQRPIAAAEQPFYYQRRPLKGVAQINRLRRGLKQELPDINLPALVLAAEGDATIAPGSAKQLFDLLGSTDKKFHCYGAEVPHVLTTDENPQQQDVFARVSEFLNRLP
ncbi:MAG TPA: alpha/beta fold hydrolase [Malonomonas sp.]